MSSDSESDAGMYENCHDSSSENDLEESSDEERMGETEKPSARKQ